MSTQSLGPARKTVLMRFVSDDGYVTADEPAVAPIIEMLHKEGYLSHVHGIVYKTTSKGNRARGQLKEEQ